MEYEDEPDTFRDQDFPEGFDDAESMGDDLDDLDDDEDLDADEE